MIKYLKSSGEYDYFIREKGERLEMENKIKKKKIGSFEMEKEVLWWVDQLQKVCFRWLVEAWERGFQEQIQIVVLDRGRRF